MVLFLHNRYRTTGGEERAVDELLALVRDRLGEPAQLLARDSATIGGVGAAAGLLRGGLAPRDVARAVQMTKARIVHAHNLNPLFGWRALAAAREHGARVVLHLHQYRLVCATGVCFTDGRECTRCHGRNTLPGVIRNCRGNRSEALAYGAALAMWQRRLVEQADAVIVPSLFARERLRELGAPLDFRRVHVLAPPVGAAAVPARPESVAGQGLDAGANTPIANTPIANTPIVDAQAVDTPAGDTSLGDESSRAKGGTYALVVSRLAPEKGIDIAIDACRIAGVPLVVAGDGPELDELRARAGAETAASRAHGGYGEPDGPAASCAHEGCGEPDSLGTAASRARGGQGEPGGPETDSSRVQGQPGGVRFVGRVEDEELERLREGAAIAIVPSRSAETFGIAAAEAMTAGVPVVASRVGALPELVEESALVEPGDAVALANAIGRLWGDADAGNRASARARELCSPAAVAERLAWIYAQGASVAS